MVHYAAMDLLSQIDLLRFNPLTVVSVIVVVDELFSIVMLDSTSFRSKRRKAPSKISELKIKFPVKEYPCSVIAEWCCLR